DSGQQVFYAEEYSHWLPRNCMGYLREFEMRIYDTSRHEVIHLERPIACDWCCCPCCLQSMDVSSPPGNLIGTIEQEWSIVYPEFVIKNPAGAIALRIKGPFWTSSCSGEDMNFKILSSDDQEQVGKIRERLMGIFYVNQIEHFVSTSSKR
ncbi:unnamed protein product, partial [Callosobruchus maculatus]